MKNYIIIVAGGNGSRMKSDIPKQFMVLNDKPILMHTINRFVLAYPTINVIVVIAKSLISQWKQLCEQYNFNVQHQLIEGGDTRYHSVKNGLNLVPNNSLVGIHDAARPLVSELTIKNVYTTALEKGNAVPVISLNESIRKLNNNNTNTAVNRNDYVIVQTPQCFHSTVLKKSFELPYSDFFTDDASVLEAAGFQINLVPGNIENIKITTQVDLLFATSLLN